MKKSIAFIERYCDKNRVPVEIAGLNRQQRSKIEYTLQRIGNIGNDIIIDNESCVEFSPVAHLLYTGGRYYIAHYKHMFMSHGQTRWTAMTHVNYCQMLQVVELLENWGLIETLYNHPKRRSTYPLKVLTTGEMSSGYYYYKPIFTNKPKEVKA